MVRVKSTSSYTSLSLSPFKGSSKGKVPPLALDFDSIRSFTTFSASVPVYSCMAFSVSSTLVAAAKSRAFCRFSVGFCKKTFFALSLEKQYFLPSLSVQVTEQLVATCWPSAKPSRHCPPNSAAGGASAAHVDAKVPVSDSKAAQEAAAANLKVLIRTSSVKAWIGVPLAAQQH